MKTHEEQIEELEKGCKNLIYEDDDIVCGERTVSGMVILCPKCKQEVKELKEEIENNLKFHRGLVCCPETCFCWDLEEQIEKLNKIIGSEE